MPCWFVVIVVSGGEKDHSDVLKQLSSVTLQKSEIHNLGLVLGISFKRLKSMEQSEIFLSEMINSWLTQVDYVPSKGRPSWERLAEALNDSTVRQTGLAQNILSKVQNFKKVSILCLGVKFSE